MVQRITAVAALLIASGCQCKPAIPDDHQDPDDTATEDTAPPPETGDTGPEPVAGPCTLTEVEPNDLPENEMALPLETYVCGEFSTGADFDRYRVVLEEDGWLGLYVDAALRGSFADVLLTVTSDVGASAERDDDDAICDAHLVVPAPAGTYSLFVVEQNLAGGEEFFYELLATVAKDPFAETSSEVEPNGDSGAASVVAGGQQVAGRIDSVGDQDWFKILVPAGKQHVVVDVEAYGLGSPANLTLFAYEAGLGQGPRAVANGLAGNGTDPYWSFDSNGNETLWFRLEELGSKGGSAWWYGLVVTVEAQ